MYKAQDSTTLVAKMTYLKVSNVKVGRYEKAGDPDLYQFEYPTIRVSFDLEITCDIKMSDVSTIFSKS